jgi:hypothetical protein
LQPAQKLLTICQLYLRIAVIGLPLYNGFEVS